VNEMQRVSYAEFMSAVVACLAKAGHRRPNIGAAGFVTVLQELNFITLIQFAWSLHLIEESVSRYIMFGPALILFFFNLRQTRQHEVVEGDSRSIGIAVTYVLATTITFILSVILLLIDGSGRPSPWKHNPGGAAVSNGVPSRCSRSAIARHPALRVLPASVRAGRGPRFFAAEPVLAVADGRGKRKQAPSSGSDKGICVK
jgi:hypothetical protein